METDQVLHVKKDTKLSLFNSEKMYSEIIDKNSLAIIIIDPENSDIVYANEAACKFYGWTLEEFLCKNTDSITVQPDKRRVTGKEEATEEKSNCFQARHKLANGEIRNVEIHSSSIEPGPKSLLCFIVFDITERTLAEEEMQRREMQLHTAQMVGNIGYWELDLTTSRVDSSDLARRIYGFEDEDLTIRMIQKIPMPEYRPMLDKALSELIKRNIPYDVQFKIIRKNDGQVRVIHSVAEYFAEKNIVIGTFQDITERKQAEDKIVEEALWRRTLMERSRDGIFIINQNGKVFEANPRYAEMLGYTDDEMHDLYIWDWDINYTREQLLEMIRYGDSKGVLLETCQKRKDGTLIDVEINANTVVFGDRKLSFCVCRDISERKKVEEYMLTAIIEAEGADKSKSEFLATISHELRTPLNSIIGFSDILKSGMGGDLNERQTSYANNIATAGKHLLELINDILDISKIEAGKMELDHERFYITEALDEIRTIISPLAIKKSIELDIRVDEIDECPMSINADRTKFKQILYNLTSNAIKFTPEKGYVTIDVTCIDDFVQISVEDTGIGIANNDLEKLFLPFKQLKPYLNREYDGTGLGLALVKKFVELHGGKIRVESKLGKGSIFTVVIPVDCHHC